MISRVYAKNFKGLTFDQPLTGRTLLSGPNGSGKTARVQAAVLVLTGCIPDITTTQAPDILGKVASDDIMEVGIECNGNVYARAYSCIGGKYTRHAHINGMAVPLKNFDKEMERLPTVFNFSAFTGLSEVQKIKHLFRAFPPEANIDTLDAEAERSRQAVLKLEADIKARYLLTDSLMRQKEQQNTPPGTLSKNLMEQKQTENELEAAMNELMEARAAAAVRAAEAKNAEKESADGKGPDKKGCMAAIREVIAALDDAPCGLDCTMRKSLEGVVEKWRP